MDKERLSRELGRVRDEAVLEEMSDHRSLVADFHSEVQRQGEELAESYRQCMRGFKDIFDLVGCSKESDDEITNPITLAVITDKALGSGRIVAELFRDDDEDDCSCVSTSVSFVPRSNKQQKRELASENFWTIGYTFRGGIEFLESNYEWHIRKLEDAKRELLPVILCAQETQTMLWEAIKDPGLNSKYAKRALALQQA